MITLNGNGHGFTNQFLIEAFGEGTQIQLSDITLSNLGTIEAEALATITIGLNGDSTNAGVIEGFNGGVITLNGNGHGFTNQFLIEALDGGGISIVGDVTNLAGASIEAIGPNAFIDVSNGTVDNQGGARIEASHRGSITFDSETVTNEFGAKIEAKDLGTITFDVGSVTNDAKIEAKHYGSITFEGSVFVKNNSDGTIEATKYGGITLDGGNGSHAGASGENDGGTIIAKDHGTITFENIGFTNQDGGTIEAKDAGTIIIKSAPDARQSSRMKARSKPSAWVRRYRSSTTPRCTAAHTFDAYSLTACQAVCFKPQLDAGAAGINCFESLDSPTFNPASISTNYVGDAGFSSNLQSFGVETIANTTYTVVVNDIAGNPLPPPAPPNTYTIQIPTCAFSCNVNQLPVVMVHDVTVTAATIGGTANASIDNGSFDPEGAALTITQFPPGPYSQGTSIVILTATDPLGASAQGTATVTVTEPAPTHATATFASTRAANLAKRRLAKCCAERHVNQYRRNPVTLFCRSGHNSGANASDFSIATGTTCATATAVTASGFCVVNITFTPGATGTRNATLTFTDDATPATQTVTLTGTGSDFAVSAPSGAVTVTAGQTAAFLITVTAGTGGFPGTVTFADRSAYRRDDGFV